MMVTENIFVYLILTARKGIISYKKIGAIAEYPATHTQGF